MKPEQLGKPLFKRKYDYRDNKKLTVQIWEPGRHDGVMMCWFRIKGMNGDTMHRAVGLDRVSALYNAMLTIGSLLHSFRDQEPSLIWPDAVYKGELGLPHPYKAPFDEHDAEWAVPPPGSRRMVAESGGDIGPGDETR